MKNHKILNVGTYIEQNHYNSIVRATRVGSDVSYYHRQIEKTVIRQLLQELPDPGLLCSQKR